MIFFFFFMFGCILKNILQYYAKNIAKGAGVRAVLENGLRKN